MGAKGLPNNRKAPRLIVPAMHCPSCAKGPFLRSGRFAVCVYCAGVTRINEGKREPVSPEALARKPADERADVERLVAMVKAGMPS